MSNLKKYNRFLISDESIPRKTLYRRRIQENSDNVSDAMSEMLIPSDSRVNADSSIKQDSANDSSESMDFDTSDYENNVEVGEDCSSTETSENEDNESNCENDFDLKNPFSPLYQSADITNFEAFLCILSFCVRFHLSGVCIEELLRLLKILLPPCTIPGTKYLLNKAIKSSIDVDKFYKIHLYCSNCGEYVSEMEKGENEVLCHLCEEKKNSSELLSKGSFFIYIPLEEQIRKKLEKQALFVNIESYRAQCVKESSYKDIICGDSYSLPEMTNSLSLQFNVDGIPMYHKAKYDLWPIHCMINELPPAERKANIMMCGLWFGSKKPIFKTYLKPFVEELNTLSENGLLWKNNGKKFCTKILPKLCTADAPARAMLQNFNQFNGKYGCGFCENEGERIERGRGYSRIYKVLYPTPAKRTFCKSVEYAELAINLDRAVKGVKGSSPLMQLYPHFNMIDGFVPDYMHCVLLGITRQFVNLWLSTSDEIYSLKKKKISEVNARINTLREPSEMTRKLRSFAEVSHWKASEWRTFLLISPVLLLDIVSPTIYQHWILFVHAITLLLGSSVSLSDLKIAESAIEKFVKGVVEIYGEGELTYNVHLLFHLPDKVKSWGPLWASSCFSYEDALGKLKNFHKGTKGVPMQILFAYLKKTLLQTLTVKQNIRNDKVEKFIDDMHHGKRTTKKTLRIKDIVLFGSGRSKILTEIEKETLEFFLNASLGENKVVTYKRALYKNILYTTKEYSEQFNRVDCFVSVLTSKLHFVEIVNVIVCKNEVIFLGEKLKTKKFSKNYANVGDVCSSILCVKEGNHKDKFKKSKIAFRPQSILQKYAEIKLETVRWFVPLLIHAEE